MTGLRRSACHSPRPRICARLQEYIVAAGTLIFQNGMIALQNGLLYAKSTVVAKS
jgi:hypothetical protein